MRLHRVNGSGNKLPPNSNDLPQVLEFIRRAPVTSNEDLEVLRVGAIQSS